MEEGSFDKNGLTVVLEVRPTIILSQVICIDIVIVEQLLKVGFAAQSLSKIRLEIAFGDEHPSRMHFKVIKQITKVNVIIANRMLR